MDGDDLLHRGARAEGVSRGRGGRDLGDSYEGVVSQAAVGMALLPRLPFLYDLLGRGVVMTLHANYSPIGQQKVEDVGVPLGGR